MFDRKDASQMCQRRLRMTVGMGSRVLVACAATVLVGSVWAKATPEEVAKLGKSLTCTGGKSRYCQWSA